MSLNTSRNIPRPSWLRGRGAGGPPPTVERPNVEAPNLVSNLINSVVPPPAYAPSTPRTNLTVARALSAIPSQSITDTIDMDLFDPTYLSGISHYMRDRVRTLEPREFDPPTAPTLQPLRRRERQTEMGMDYDAIAGLTIANTPSMGTFGTINMVDTDPRIRVDPNGRVTVNNDANGRFSLNAGAIAAGTITANRITMDSVTPNLRVNGARREDFWRIPDPVSFFDSPGQTLWDTAHSPGHSTLESARASRQNGVYGFDKAVLEFLKEKLSLNIKASNAGKGVEIKVSLNLIDTGEEILSDSDIIELS